MSSSEKTYWMPETLPSPTVEWNAEQNKKFYFTKEDTVRPFPGWFYDNGAAVCADYLFYNEGWRLVIDNEPRPKVEEMVELKPQEMWEYTERTVTKTYWVRTVIDDIPKYDISKYRIQPTPIHSWNYSDEYVIKTYDIIEMTQDEIDFEIKKRWSDFKEEREIRLRKTDYVVIKSIEKNLTVSPEMLEYRQALRDLPDKLEDIWSDYMKLFPSLPEKEFVEE